jgi:hypothetical protein
MGLFVSMTMTSGIMQKFQDMSAYNSIREDALFQAMAGIQSDNVELRNTNLGNTAIFQEPSDSSSPTYDLTAISGMKSVRKVPRFFAWYYTKRFPLVDEGVLKDALDKFINGGPQPFMRDGLKRFVYIDPADWDSTKLRIKKLSYTLWGERTVHPVAGKFTVTCGGCPGIPYILDSVADKIKLINMDEDDNLIQGGALDAIGFTGTLPLKLDASGLLMELQNSYGDIFCDLSCPFSTPIVRDSDWDKVREDMRVLLVRIKEVLNMPDAERLRGLTQWFTPFYDPSAHNADHSAKVAGDQSSDLYLRLIRDKEMIQTWITNLSNFNQLQIIDKITLAYGSSCEQGRGEVTDQCYVDWTFYDPCWECTIGTITGPCGIACTDKKGTPKADARWAGNYGTCVSGPGGAPPVPPYSGNPVCQNGIGDFYQAIPAWCSDYRVVYCLNFDSFFCEYQETQITGDYRCCGTCSAPGETFSSVIPQYKYQGQLSWRRFAAGQYDWTEGPTELGQAIDILQEWYDDLTRMQEVIAALQDQIAVLQDPLQQQYTLRNNLVYAWTDKAGSVTNMPQYSHIASVAIKDYPLNLPYISEKTDFEISWIGGCKTRTLHEYKGSFEVKVSRYDQDQPNQIWNLRRRKNPLTAEYNIGTVNSIVSDIQTSGRITTGALELLLLDILDNYAIISKSKVHYGPERADIAIIGVDGN